MSIQISTLQNGLRVVTHAMDHLETVSLGLWVGAGSRFESVDEHGLAHLLEHMAFKGTGRRTARGIAEEIESVGGDLNAATSLETTAYYARVMKQDLSLGVDLLSDIIINPTFDDVELEREKNVIIQEISATNDSPDDVIYDIAQDHAFPNQALGRPILGTEESVRALSGESLRAFRDQLYSSDAMVMAAAGGLDHDGLVAKATEHFGSIKRFEPRGAKKAVYRGGFCRSPLSFEQSHLVVAYEGPSYLSDNYYAAQILSTILGGGMSSRLFQEAREARGLCYSIYAFCWGVIDSGLMGVHAATAPDQLGELLDVVADEIRAIADEAASGEEIARAKAQLKAGLLMSLESSSARAEQLARQTLAFGAPLAICDVIAKVDAVTAEEVQSAAKKIFEGSSPTFASVGPADGLSDTKALVRKFGSGVALAAE